MNYSETLTLVVLGAGILALLCAYVAATAWAAKKQRERIAESVEDWCDDVASRLESRANTPLSERSPWPR